MTVDMDQILLSAIERFKNGEETPEDRAIIGKALAAKQIEIVPAEDSKIIGQAGGADFGESNEIRVSGSVIGTQTVSGITAEQVKEIIEAVRQELETSKISQITDKVSEIENKVSSIFSKTNTVYHQGVYVGGTVPDFFVVSPTGSTSIFEVTPWEFSSESIDRARDLVKKYELFSGTDHAYLVVSDLSDSDPANGIVTPEDLEQEIKSKRIQEKSTPEKPEPVVGELPEKKNFCSYAFS